MAAQLPGIVPLNCISAEPTLRLRERLRAKPSVEAFGGGINQPQSNGIVERLHCTLLGEHLRVECRGNNGRTPLKALKAFADGIRKGDNPQPKPTKKAA